MNPSPSIKIASLLPSATEIICQLGLASNLVGVSHECDFPDPVKTLPRLTRSRIKTNSPSGEIHANVAEMVKNAVSVYDLELDTIKRLQPDYLVTQDLCDVCAVSFDQVKNACDAVFDFPTRIISLRPKFLDDIWGDLKRVSETFGAYDRYEKFRAEVDERIQRIKTSINTHGPEKKKVLTVEWLDPVYIGGMWVPEMIDICGGEYLLAAPGKPAQCVDYAALEKINPDVVVVKPCGFDLNKTQSDFELLNSNIPWKGWNAWETGQVYLVDGNAYFNRPGPRIIDSLEILAACVHPELFPEFWETYGDGIIQLGPRF